MNDKEKKKKDKDLSKGELRDKIVLGLKKAEKRLEILGNKGDFREQLRFMVMSLGSDLYKYD